MWLLLFHLSIIFQYCFCENLVTDVTRQVLNIPANVNGFATAYTDINNDKLTDICLVSGDRKMVSLLLGGSETGKPLTLYKSLHVLESNLYIVGTVPGDFNGDGNVDILVSMLDTSSLKRLVQIKLFWGNKENTFTNQQNIDGLIQDEPLMLDANADMISDLLVTLPSGTRQFWLGHLGPVTENWTFNAVSFSTSLPNYPVKSPHSNSFVDLSGDGAADLFITSVDLNNEAVFEIWKGTELELKLISNYSFSSLLLNHNIEVGQSVFADINGDGLQEHILPVCELQEKRCIHSMIFVYLDGDWIELFSGEDHLNFISSQTSFLNVPITLVLGDFNQDIHMDLVCVMQTTNDSKSQAHILYGGPCSDAKCQKANHQFSHKLAIPNSDGAFSASFYSLQNNGALDILVSTSATNVSLHAYHNIGVNDASFVTIKVLPGSEEIRSCNVAGPTVQYNSINVMGGNQRFSAVQLSQSAHLSLQLPYVSFGLGRLPNFIDSITVFVPLPLIPPSSAGSQNKYEVLHSTWTMLIPNSKLYVIPYPVNDTSMWRNILVVTPSRNIVSTAIVLLSTCFIVAITTTILHCLERREDKREKIREAHRFHFDAM